MKVLNLSAKPATLQQKAEGLVDLSNEDWDILQKIISNADCSNINGILETSLEIAGFVQARALQNQCEKVLLGETDFVGPALEQLLKDLDFATIRYLPARMRDV